MEHALPDPVTVLLLDTDPSLAERMPDTVSRREGSRQHEVDLEVIVRNSKNAGLERLAPDVDCVLSEYDLPDADGLAVLEAVREGYPDLPVLLVTDAGSEEVAAAAIQHGVTSYLRKETVRTDVSELVERILTHVAEYRTRVGDRSEMDHQLVAEAATDVFFQVDLATGDVEMSDGIAQFGYDPEAIDPDHEWWIERIHPDDRDRLLAEHEAVTTPDAEGFETFTGARGRFENEFRWRRADGSYAAVRARGLTVFEDGEAVVQIGTMTDITERMERRQELELLETLLDYAHDAMYVVDADSGEIVRVNQTATGQLGYDSETLVGMTIADISASHEGSATWQAETPDLSVGDSFSKEDVHVRADGSTFPVELSVGYAEIGEGPETRDYYIAIVRDISERTERERELELAETVFEQSNDEVYVTDVESGEIRQVNQTACDHLEYSREELIGKPVTSVTEYFEDFDEWQAHIDEVVADEGVRDETAHVRADGSTYPVEVSVSYTEFDAEAYLITIARDITERMERERELTRQNERLENFASIVSHDLQNPLNIAEGRLDLAREECESPHLDDVKRAHSRMESLIEGLLSLARQGKRVRETAEIDLADAAVASWQMVNTEDAELITDTSHAVEGDPDRLKELLENLFRNAVEHAGEAVTVTVGDLEDGFYVADDGPGIPEDDREEIFDLGYSTGDAGSGIGLHIVEMIAEAHDWEVAITDSADGGARFEFRETTSPAH